MKKISIAGLLLFSIVNVAYAEEVCGKVKKVEFGYSPDLSTYTVTLDSGRKFQVEPKTFIPMTILSDIKVCFNIDSGIGYATSLER